MTTHVDDPVVYQNWLMKRSQLTRVFRRRFTVLTAKGKLYSFRKVDLTKPDSILPSNASLSYDIRFAVIEKAPKLGCNTWTVKPGPSSTLREEIHLRTCSACPESTCTYWMHVMSAIANRNLYEIIDNNSTLTLAKLHIPHTSSSVVYGEFEGSLFPVQERGPTEIPVRFSDPGSCLILKVFSPQDSSGETPVAESEPIPRYSFWKSRATRVCRPTSISLKGEKKYCGSVILSINEGLAEYFQPLFTVKETFEGGITEDFDFGVFKFQIRRLIRIIDLISGLKEKIVDVFEWRDFNTSASWLVYLTFALLLVPGYIPILSLGHIAQHSLSQSEDFMAWWNKSTARSDGTHSSTIEQSNPATPCRATEPSYPVTPCRATSSSSFPAVSSTLSLKEAASNAIQQMSSAFRSPQGDSGAITAEIWENQRRMFAGSQFTASNLSVFDRSRWSDESGRVALDPPSSGDWKINLDRSSGTTDENGWSYNTRWGSSEWHASFTGWDFVRRRCWVPVYRGGVASLPEQTTASDPSCEALPREVTEMEYPTSLSGVVTTGVEYGNIQEDYDEANAEFHQPKQSGIGSFFNEFKSTAARAQLEIGEICDSIERLTSLFSWRDHVISTLATLGIFVGMLALLLIPVNVLVYIYIMSFFHLGYRRSRWFRVAVDACYNQHVLPLITGGVTDPRTLGGLEAHRLCLALHKRTGVNLSQKVLADMTSNRNIAEWICRQSPAFKHYRKWMRRDWIENLLDHIPPQVSVEQQIFFSDSSSNVVPNLDSPEPLS